MASLAASAVQKSYMPGFTSNVSAAWSNYPQAPWTSAPSLIWQDTTSNATYSSAINVLTSG